jgi:hypothetical protein
VLFLTGNALELSRYYREGRGHYGEIVAWMVAQKPDGLIRVSSDHPFRHQMLLAYYSHKLGASQRFEYVPPERFAVSPPDFLLLHSLDRNWTPPREGDAIRFHYVLAKAYGSIGTVGWPTAIYVRSE